MSHRYDQDDPEYVIASLNRSRHIKQVAVVVGIAVALSTLFVASLAMYNEDPVARSIGKR